MEPPDPTERGFKDTVKANPGYFTTIRPKLELRAGVTAPQNVYHCHIVEHEAEAILIAKQTNIRRRGGSWVLNIRVNGVKVWRSFETRDAGFREQVKAERRAGTYGTPVNCRRYVACRSPTGGAHLPQSARGRTSSNSSGSTGTKPERR
jgi:hypothetical protein